MSTSFGAGRRRLTVIAAVLGIALTVFPIFGGGAAIADHVPYAVGDVFVGVGNGHIKHFDPSGNLLETLDNTVGFGEQTGMCFDGAGNLRSTNFSDSTMSLFDNQGGLVQHPWGSGFNADPESCVIDAAGNVYVGQADGTADILKFDSAGNALGSFDPATTDRGTDWIDLAADQCTMFYTSEGSEVKRFNVCTNTQMADFATDLARPCFGLRIRANGEVLTTCGSQTYRFDSNGTVIDTYPISSGDSLLFAMNIDPDGTSFWRADIFNGHVEKIDIASGAVLTEFTSDPEVSSAGLAIFGEPTQGGGGGGGCVEDGLMLLAGSGIASGAIHNLEPTLQGTLGSLVPTIGADVHNVNCNTVVPLEDQVDALVASLGL